MMLMKLLLGLIGLGIVVFVHELGHFIAARLSGIRVTAFSLGWGPALLHKKIGETDFRISCFPVGGYCTLEGQGDFEKTWKDHKNGLAPERGSFFAASPPRRIITALAGPLFNALFSIAVFSLIIAAGQETVSVESRIVLARDITGESYPADRAGLMTGDLITAIDGKPVRNARDTLEGVSLRAKKSARLSILRAGEALEFTLEPELEKETGAGKIGVYFWIEPLIAEVAPDSPASRAGLMAGDRVIRINGEPFPYQAALYRIYPGGKLPDAIPVTVDRGGNEFETIVNLTPEDAGHTGITWPHTVYRSGGEGVFASLGAGAARMWTTFTAAARNITLLFRGIDLTKALSGPLRISYMAGDVATDRSGAGTAAAVRAFFEFLALVSTVLAVMNLLPLPILDGGLIALFTAEWIRRRPVHPRFYTILQTAGIALIAALMLLAMYADIMFFVRG